MSLYVSPILTPPTFTLQTSTGAAAGYLFIVSGISTPPSAGDTYTNNSNTFTVLGISNGNTALWMSHAGTATFSGTTLTRTAGAGDASITFQNAAGQNTVVPQKLSTYTPPAGCLAIKVTAVGQGGAGGGCGTAASTAAAGGGGGGGATVITWIQNPGATTYYTGVGLAGGGAQSGNNPGLGGQHSGFCASGGPFLFAPGGGGGGGGGTSTNGISSGGGVAGVASASVTAQVIAGTPGGNGLLFTAGVALSGAGGGSHLAGNTAGVINTSSAGNNGLQYGAGGSGGIQINNGGNQSGGTGANGLVYIEEYYS